MENTPRDERFPPPSQSIRFMSAGTDPNVKWKQTGALAFARNLVRRFFGRFAASTGKRTKTNANCVNRPVRNRISIKWTTGDHVVHKFFVNFFEI